jgi:hypothetical protein
MVLPLNVYRRSLVRSNNPQKLALSTNCAIRKDPAVHVSLSSYSVVKQPGANPSPIAGSHQSLHPTTNDNRTTAGCLCTHLSEELRGTETCLRLWGLGSAALSGRFISPRFVYCQRQSSTNCRIALHRVPVRGSRERPIFSRFTAALEPQCCDVLG